MKKLFTATILLFINSFSSGQNLYPEKFDDCNLTSFCVDCGETKSAYKGDLNTYFAGIFTSKQLKGIEGIVFVQVLIDTTGKQCVKSISNQASGTISKLELRNSINSMTGWQPAVSKGKPENVSITLQFVFKNGGLNVSYQRFDPSKTTNMISVGDVEITNKNYDYSKNSTSINCQVFTTQNSIIPWDMSRSISVDSNNVVWYGTDNGIVKIEDGNMTLINSQNSSLRTKRDKTTIMYSDVDIYNNKWFTDGYNTYMFNGTDWTIFDSTNTPLKWTTGIYADRFGSVWFTTFNGLVKYDGSNWSIIDTSNSKLPFNRTSGVFMDGKKRLWIGTYEGNIRIDGTNVETFQTSDNPLKNASLLSGYEDKQGNIWLSLYEEERQFSGLAKLSPSGEWTMYNISNSGIPTNDVLDFTIDETSNTIWMSINKVGITKYDGTNWSIFTPENSDVPSTYIQDITLDKHGNLWCATFAGLLKISTK